MQLDQSCTKQLVYPTVSDLSEQLLKKNRLAVKYSDLESFIFFQVQSGRIQDRGVKREVASRIVNQVKKDQPLEMAVIAIAHKNPVAGACNYKTMPDLAELGFLQYLVDILDGVQNIYPPGARMTILTEGEFYKNGEILDVSIDEIQRYESGVRFMADSISDGRINLVPLQRIVSQHPRFMEVYQQQLATIKPEVYGKYVAVMGKSMTPAQKDNGPSAVDMARRYCALHKAKHLCRDDGNSSIYSYLAQTLGPNYLYCSVTRLERPEVLVIDPYRKYREPYLLPQHGLGVLKGGTSDVEVVQYYDLLHHAQEFRVGSIVCKELGDQSFGYIDYGAKKK